MSYSPSGERPHRFSERTEAIAGREGLPADRACLLAIEEHVGVVLGAGLLAVRDDRSHHEQRQRLTDFADR